MKRAKDPLIIISTSYKTDQFWEHYLKYPAVKTWNLNSSADSFSICMDLKPVLIILDEYYDAKEDLIQLSDAKIGIDNSTCPLVHLSPINSNEDYNSTGNGMPFQRYAFSQSFLENSILMLNQTNPLKTVG